MQASHHALFVHQSSEISRQLLELCRLHDCDPWDVFFLVLDLRAQFGRQVALHFRTQTEIDEAIRNSEANGAPAGFSVPIDMPGAIELIELFVPTLREQVELRPSRVVAALIVDENDDPCIAYIRFVEPGTALS